MKIRFKESFKDGTILGNKKYSINDEIEVTPVQAAQIARSGGVFEVLVDKPVVKEEQVEKQLKIKKDTIPQ